MSTLTFSDKQKTFFERRLKLINNATKYELDFKLKLDQNNVKYIFQKGFFVGDFYCIVDFYIPKPYKICVEIDGGYHQTKEQIKRDYAKDKYLKSRGFKIVRINNEDVESYNVKDLVK